MGDRDRGAGLRALALGAVLTLSVLAAPLAPVAQAAAGNTTSSCTTIDSPGVYELDGRIDTSSSTCFDVTSSDVVLDGQGNTVDMSGSGTAVALTTSGSVSNVTVRNLAVRNATDGMAVSATTGGASVTGLTFRNNDVNVSGTGFGVASNANATVADVLVAGNSIRTYDWSNPAINVEATLPNKFQSATGAVRNVTIRDNFVDNKHVGLKVLAEAYDGEVTGLSITGNTIYSGESATDFTFWGNRGDYSVDLGNNYLNATAANKTPTGGDGVSLNVVRENASLTLSATDNVVVGGHDGMGIVAREENQTLDVSLERNDVTGTVTLSDLGTSGADYRAVEFTAVDNVVSDGSITMALSDRHSSLDAEILGNTIDTTGVGIYVTGPGFEGSLNASIAGNVITGGPTSGVRLWTSGGYSTLDATITGNEIDSADTGIDLMLDENELAGELWIVDNRVTAASSQGVLFQGIQLRDVEPFEAFVASNDVRVPGGNGVEIQSASGSGGLSGLLSVQHNDITAGNAAVLLSSGPVEGIHVYGNDLAGGSYGVENRNTSAGAVLVATDNYWGASDGPGSAGPYEDPVTGALADGSGGAVTNATASTANVYFDPYLASRPRENFSVTVDGTDSPVDESETLTVTATVQNHDAGDNETSQTVELSVGGTVRDATTVSLLPGEVTTVALSWTTAAGDGGDHTATVSSEDDSATASVTVESSSSPTPTDTPTETPRDTPTDSPTPTESPRDTPTETATAAPTDTPTATITPTATPTDTPTATPTATATASPTGTATPTAPSADDPPSSTPTTTATGAPGFGVAVAAVALLAIGLRRTRRGSD